MTTRIAAPALSLLVASSLIVACSDPPQVIQIPFQNTNVLVERSDCAPNTNCVGAIKSKVDNPTLSFDLTLRNVVTNIGTFPEERIRALAAKVPRLVVAEMNLGQIRLEVERLAAGHAQVQGVHRADGLAITPEQILAALQGQ